MEAGILCLLVPWALLNGELARMIATIDAPEQWALIWASAALGGVRALSQILVLNVASATTLAASNLGIQVAAPPASPPVAPPRSPRRPAHLARRPATRAPRMSRRHRRR